MPLWMIAPLVNAAPESKLPVCAGWIPCPVADFMKRPLMTFILVLNGARGESVLLSCMLAPLPEADHSLGLMPQPMNITAKRRGNFASPPPVTPAAGDSAPHAGSDSSQ